MNDLRFPPTKSASSLAETALWLFIEIENPSYDKNTLCGGHSSRCVSSQGKAVIEGHCDWYLLPNVWFQSGNYISCSLSLQSGSRYVGEIIISTSSSRFFHKLILPQLPSFTRMQQEAWYAWEALHGSFENFGKLEMQFYFEKTRSDTESIFFFFGKRHWIIFSKASEEFRLYMHNGENCLKNHASMTVHLHY